MTQQTPREKNLDAIVRRYSLLVTGEVIAIPVPGVDMAAVFLTWAKMVQEVGKLYGEEMSLSDARRFAWLFIRSALSAGGAWFGSAALAQSFLKAFPLGGKLAAYLIDATIAGSAIGKITSGLARAADEHFKEVARELAGEEREKKKSPAFNEVLSQAISTGQSLALIVNGLKKR